MYASTESTISEAIHPWSPLSRQKTLMKQSEGESGRDVCAWISKVVFTNNSTHVTFWIQTLAFNFWAKQTRVWMAWSWIWKQQLKDSILEIHNPKANIFTKQHKTSSKSGGIPGLQKPSAYHIPRSIVRRWVVVKLPFYFKSSGLVVEQCLEVDLVEVLLLYYYCYSVLRAPASQ